MRRIPTTQRTPTTRGRGQGGGEVVRGGRGISEAWDFFGLAGVGFGVCGVGLLSSGSVKRLNEFQRGRQDIDVSRKIFPPIFARSPSGAKFKFERRL